MADVFVNPYTFVPFPKAGKSVSNLTNVTEPLFSGEIKCRLITRTQIAVPDLLKNPVRGGNENDRTEPKKYDFFNIDGKAAIPGSGIRGVIRSVYEVLTDSCMHLNDKDDDYFHSRVNKTEPGIITYDKQNGYVLGYAERIRDKTKSRYKTGDIVRFNSKPGNNTDLVESFSDSGTYKGVYLRVDTFGKGAKASNPSVFVFKKKGQTVKLDKVYVDRLKANVDMYEGKYKADYQKAIDRMEKDGGWLPVWFWVDEKTGHYYLAPSQYSRAVFVNKPRDLVEKANMQHCTSQKECCAACALFGFIGDGKDEFRSRASRVRFTDALCETADCFDGSYILPVLSTPRLSSFEFYLDSNGQKKFGPDSANVNIAGRKFYWHAPQNEIHSDDDFGREHPKMATKMQLVKKGCEFTFSVFFDKITDEQLKKLVFALNLGENNRSSARCHKIGHGKPVGLGSVKIVAEQVTKRSFNGGVYSVDDVTEEIVGAANIALFRSTPEFNSFMTKVVNLNYAAKYDVDYPRKDKGGDIFEWFADNRGSLRSKGYIEVNNFLPKITDSDPTLTRSPKPEKAEDSRNNGGNRNGSGGFNRNGGQNYRGWSKR